jgi:hypothetical protein
MATLHEAAEHAATKLPEGPVAVAFVDRATRYEVWLTPVEFTDHWLVDRNTAGRTLVALPDFHAAHTFNLADGGLHWRYVAEKLRLNQGDAEPITEFLRALAVCRA